MIPFCAQLGFFRPGSLSLTPRFSASASTLGYLRKRTSAFCNPKGWKTVAGGRGGRGARPPGYGTQVVCTPAGVPEPLSPGWVRCVSGPPPGCIPQSDSFRWAFGGKGGTTTGKCCFALLHPGGVPETNLVRPGHNGSGTPAGVQPICAPYPGGRAPFPPRPPATLCQPFGLETVEAPFRRFPNVDADELKQGVNERLAGRKNLRACRRIVGADVRRLEFPWCSRLLQGPPYVGSYNSQTRTKMRAFLFFRA